MLKKIYLSCILCLVIIIGTSLTGCITEEEPAEHNIEEIAIQTVEHLRNSEFNQAYEFFNVTVTDQMTIQQLEEIWDLLLTQYGEFDKIMSTRIDIEAGYDIVFVTCNFSILGFLDIKMVFDDEKRIAGFQFVPTEIEYKYDPPEYVDLEVFDEVNVTVGTGLWMLPGTLTIPKVKDFAWGLASKGTAVLRYEKRTKEYPEQSAALTNLTVQDEVIDDVIAAIDVLNTTGRIDQERMFVLGHSLGGMLGPRITEQDDRLAGLIILAGPTRGLENLFLEQTTYLANLDGEIDENEAIQIANIQEQVDKVKELNISEGEFILGVPKAYWQDLADYNPVETAENLSTPILILQGERDYQVTIDGDFSKWNESLYTNDNVTLKTYESLNHLFISGSGPPTNAEYLVEGHVEEEVIVDISEWIKNH
jgi:alpha-beta hydrolase superfamily lysophospholipase